MMDRSKDKMWFMVAGIVILALTIYVSKMFGNVLIDNLEAFMNSSIERVVQNV